jgi:hypothetical protein
MGAADKRVADLLDRWLRSVELHARYLELDAEAYAKVQDWPKHQRPTRWVVELAHARLQELRRHLSERQQQRDEGFAESLELMAFLTNLLGSENIERFIPLAIPPAEEPDSKSAASATAPPPARPAAAKPSGSGSASAGASATPAARRSTKPARKPAAQVLPEPQPSTGPGREAELTVIADAIRFLNWGREWPALAGLIARLANRPPESEVWAILKRHRVEIESRAKQGDERR